MQGDKDSKKTARIKYDITASILVEELNLETLRDIKKLLQKNKLHERKRGLGDPASPKQSGAMIGTAG